MENFVYSSSFVKAYDYTIVVPRFNQDHGTNHLLKQLETVLDAIDRKFLVMVVDYDTGVNAPPTPQDFQFKNSRIDLQLVSMPFPGDRQLAILEGLSVAQRNKCEHFIVMEGDGNDDPQAIPELINTSGMDVVFLDKGPKADNLLFWLIYRFHQFFFWLLTSKEIDFSHYSMINRKALNALLEDQFLHYTTALHNKALNIGKVRYEHPMRQFGREYRELFRHSILSFLEFGEELLNIFLKFSLGLSFLFFGGAVAMLGLVYFTDITLPNWTIFTLVGLFNALLVSIGFFALGIMVLNQKKQYSNTLRTSGSTDGGLLLQNHLGQNIQDPTRWN